MAAKDKKTAGGSGTKITRITASDTKKAEKKPVKKPISPAKTKATVAESKAVTPAGEDKPTQSLATPFVAMGRYFKGAWYELKQVRWPTRRATWSLTGAMLVFTAFFVVLILLLDALFKYLFELMLG